MNVTINTTYFENNVLSLVISSTMQQMTFLRTLYVENFIKLIKKYLKIKCIFYYYKYILRGHIKYKLTH